MNDIFSWFMLILCVSLLIGVVVYTLFNLTKKTVTRRVKVVGKRTSTSTDENGSQTYYHCTFEFEDGQRKEYVIGAQRYKLIAEGDRGDLATKGAFFWDFCRVTE